MIKPEWGAPVRALARDAYWYAAGRQDRWPAQADPMKFAAHFGDLAHSLAQNETSFCPSIQDAYAAWREQIK